LEIVVLDRKSDKLIRMEVQPKHTIGSIIETIVDKQKMNKSQRYKLSLGAQSFGKEQYLLKVKDAGINQGDHLILEAEKPLLAPVAVKKRKKEKKSEKRAVTPPRPVESRPAKLKAPEAPPGAKPPIGYTPKFCLHPALVSVLLIAASLASLLIPVVTVTSPITVSSPVTVSRTSFALIRLTTDVTDVSLSRIGDMYVMYVTSMKTVITSSYMVPYLATFMGTSTTTTHNLVPFSALIGNLATILVLATVSIAAAGVYVRLRLRP
jgi:hypothetical protein